MVWRPQCAGSCGDGVCKIGYGGCKCACHRADSISVDMLSQLCQQHGIAKKEHGTRNDLFRRCERAGKFHEVILDVKKFVSCVLVNPVPSSKPLKAISGNVAHSTVPYKTIVSLDSKKDAHSAHSTLTYKNIASLVSKKDAHSTLAYKKIASLVSKKDAHSTLAYKKIASLVSKKDTQPRRSTPQLRYDGRHSNNRTLKTSKASRAKTQRSGKSKQSAAEAARLKRCKS